MRPRKGWLSGVQELPTSEDNIAESAKGRRGGPDGVLDHGACEEDGPGTWEALISLEKTTGVTETR